MPRSARQVVILRALAERSPIERRPEDQDDWADLERRGFVKVRTAASGETISEITEKGRAALDVSDGIKTVGTRPRRDS